MVISYPDLWDWLRFVFAFVAVKVFIHGFVHLAFSVTGLVHVIVVWTFIMLDGCCNAAPCEQELHNKKVSLHLDYSYLCSLHTLEWMELATPPEMVQLSLGLDCQLNRTAWPREIVDIYALLVWGDISRLHMGSWAGPLFHLSWFVSFRFVSPFPFRVL